MIDSEERKFIKDEIARQMNVILGGSSGENNQETESIFNMFPGMPQIPSRPVMHPFGFVSRATEGTVQVTGRQGEHFGNRLILGHRDKSRPSDLEKGEAVIYASDGSTVLRRINLNLNSIQIGSSNSDEPLILGNVLRNFLREWLNTWLQAEYIGISPVGPVFLKPEIRQKFLQLIDTFIEQQSTNIISQENFTERKNA